MVGLFSSFFLPPAGNEGQAAGGHRNRAELRACSLQASADGAVCRVHPSAPPRVLTCVLLVQGNPEQCGLPGSSTEWDHIHPEASLWSLLVV